MEYVRKENAYTLANPLTHTFCQEKTTGYQNVVGGFGSSGLTVGFCSLRQQRRCRCPSEALRPLVFGYLELELDFDTWFLENWSIQFLSSMSFLDFKNQLARGLYLE